jgi:hypothetical protein
MFQGLQIDTDHWRHLYLLFGLLFGFAAADRAVRGRRLADPPAFSASHPHLRPIV